MSTNHPISRRKVLRQGGNVLAAGTLVSLLPSLASAANPITVGFIYVGPRQDFGWNQSHWDAAKKIAAMDGVKVVEQENVPETAEVEKVMKSMIQLDGAKVIMATSFGYWKSILKMAEAYPDVLFTHIGAIWKPGNPKNVIGYRGYMEEPHYLCGIAAGRMSKGYLATETALRGLRGRAATAADEALKIALYDPQLAKEMVGSIYQPKVPGRAKRLQARLFALGVPYSEEER